MAIDEFRAKNLRIAFVASIFWIGFQIFCSFVHFTYFVSISIVKIDLILLSILCYWIICERVNPRVTIVVSSDTADELTADGSRSNTMRKRSEADPESRSGSPRSNLLSIIGSSWKERLLEWGLTIEQSRAILSYVKVAILHSVLRKLEKRWIDEAI